MKKSIWSVAVISIALALGGRHFSGRSHGEEPKRERWPRIDQSQYAGSAKCAECHQSHYSGWKDSAHNKMIRTPIADGPDKTVFADFSVSDPIKHFDLKDVKWVIGHRWKQRFIGEVGGQEVVFPAQWSMKEKKWQPYEGKSDWWYCPASVGNGQRPSAGLGNLDGGIDHVRNASITPRRRAKGGGRQAAPARPRAGLAAL